MQKLNLKNVTLLGVDCINIERLIVAAEICQKKIQFGAVKLLSHLSYKNYNIAKIPKIECIEDYSRFMVKELSKYVDTDYVLIFQHDGFILNPNGWKSEFLNFDYVGSCWWYDDKYNVGNGGFSLRSKRLIDMLAADNCIFEYHPEDYIICRTYGEYLKGQGIKFAPESVANEFSIENKKWANEFGFHQADITDWEINKYVDKFKYPKYYNLFYETFPDAKKNI